MRYYADLHIHSKYSRATSQQCDLEHLLFWARKKGITLLGTGDFTHPAWRAELKEKLVPAEPGLFRLRPDLEAEVERRRPAVSQGPTRFLLSVEISTIYKKGDRTRKIHHLIYAPDFDSVDRMVQRLSRIGNLASDGRPILGLDSRHLLEVVLDSGQGCYLVPAHIWTPWFAVLGSKSGFDSVTDCYGDLAPHVFALETGLSSDPPMNWRVSSLHPYRLISNSDAHSPDKLGREACVFDTELDYFALRRALETGGGYVGTVEFFPEEGKYHLDGHRKCGVRLTPQETRAHAGRCPSCGDAVTVGVLHRVDELADRDEGPPPTAGEVRSLVPLPEILAEIHGTGPGSHAVERAYETITRQLGPELMILEQVPLEDIARIGSRLLAEALSRLRRGQVLREAGYDGQYGRIRLFKPEELRPQSAGGLLFEGISSERDRAEAPAVSRAASEDVSLPNPEQPLLVAESAAAPAGPPLTDGLDLDQRAAVEMTSGPLLILAGPGSGKTRTLTHRIAHLVARCGAAPERCLAVTFTRRAAEEMRERLQSLVPGVAARIPVYTFHGLGHSILRAHGPAVGLRSGFRVAEETERLALLRDALPASERQARRLLGLISTGKRTGAPPGAPEVAEACDAYERAMAARDLVDLDDLVGRAARLLESEPRLREHYRELYRWVSVDEYQDIDEQQYRLVRQLVPPDGHLCVIGDPDQAIYGFRGADARLIDRLRRDFPTTRVVRLKRNYRSGRTIVEASGQVLSPTDPERPPMEALAGDSNRIVIHAAPTERAEAEFVVRTMEQLIGGHSFFSLDSGRASGSTESGWSFSDFAVLYRMDSQTEALSEALARSGFPFQKRSHDALSEHPGVRALVRELGATPQSGPLMEGLRAAAARLLRQKAEDRAAVEAGAELLRPLAEGCGEDLQAFVSELALGTQVDTWDPRADRVSLLTLHAAKGLEFQVVFIVGCEDGLLPLRWSDADEADGAEERRLFYVGMTRARDRLFLSWARRRRWYGRLRDSRPSPFLHDIERRLLEQREAWTRARRPDTVLEQRRLF